MSSPEGQALPAQAGPALEAVDGDAELARRSAGGDLDAFGRLMQRHNQRLFRLARSVLGDAAEAEDALQDAYLAAHRALAGFRGESQVSTWLSRIVLNQCADRRRRQARRDNIIPLVASGDDGVGDAVDAVSADSEGPDRACARAELRSVLEDELDALPEMFRTVFVLRSVEELSVEETAECLGIPVATVRTRHFRARALLRDALARGLDLAERDIYEFGGERCAGLVERVVARLAAGET